MSRLFLFGYASLLQQRDVKRSLDQKSEKIIPVKLDGYERTWDAFFKPNETKIKRYIYPKTAHKVNIFGWANIRSTNSSLVNGICYNVTKEQFEKLDFREEGYNRIEVTEKIIPYPSFSLPKNFKCYTYTFEHPNKERSENGILSKSYYDMVVTGAKKIDQQVPGFYDDFKTSTEDFTGTKKEISQIYFSEDGRNLIFLNEDNSKTVLLHRFKKPQFPTPTENPKGQRHSNFIELNDNYRIYNDHYLKKNSAAGSSSNRLNKLRLARNCDLSICENLIDSDDPWIRIQLVKNRELSSEWRKQLLDDKNWLVRLIASDKLKTKMKADLNSDPWIERNLK